MKEANNETRIMDGKCIDFSSDHEAHKKQTLERNLKIATRTIAKSCL